jgi:hypothetical protein
MCADCIDKWLAEESAKNIQQRYGDTASTTTREQAVDIYKIARDRFDTHEVTKVYTLIKHGDLIIRVSRTTRDGAVDAVAYQSMNSIETSAVHNRMRTDGFALVE